MAVQKSTALRDAQNDQIEVITGVSALLRLFSGAQPANCAAADAGTLLCEIALPADWMNASAAGVKSKQGTWSGTGVANNTAAHFRIKDVTGATCHLQGSVTQTGSGGDMTLDNPSITIGQIVTINTFTATASGA